MIYKLRFLAEKNSDLKNWILNSRSRCQNEGRNEGLWLGLLLGSFGSWIWWEKRKENTKEHVYLCLVTKDNNEENGKEKKI